MSRAVNSIISRAASDDSTCLCTVASGCRHANANSLSAGTPMARSHDSSRVAAGMIDLWWRSISASTPVHATCGAAATSDWVYAATAGVDDDDEDDDDDDCLLSLADW